MSSNNARTVSDGTAGLSISFEADSEWKQKAVESFVEKVEMKWDYRFGTRQSKRKSEKQSAIEAEAEEHEDSAVEYEDARSDRDECQEALKCKSSIESFPFKDTAPGREIRLMEIRSSADAVLPVILSPLPVWLSEASILSAIGSLVLKCLTYALTSFVAGMQPRTHGNSDEAASDDSESDLEAENTGTTIVQGVEECTTGRGAWPSNVDDSWLDDWDLIIHRCIACKKPFHSAERLENHRSYHCSRVPAELPNVYVNSVLSAPIVRIDKDGDLEIQVGSEEASILKRFLVASQVLRCQSRAFYASFCESYAFKGSTNIRRAHLLRPSEPAVIFLDDDPDALELILMVLHHRYLELPQKVEFKVLVEVAAVCEKYMLHVPLAPIANMWAKSWTEKAFEKGYEDWLLVAWVFGVDDMFVSVSKHIALNLMVTLEHEWVRHDGEKLHQALPESVTAKLFKQRDFALRPIRDRFETIQAQRMFKYAGTEEPKQEGLTCAKIICGSPKRAQECDWLQLGHLMETTARYKLDTSMFWNKSINDLVQFFETLREEGREVLHPSDWVSVCKESDSRGLGSGSPGNNEKPEDAIRPCCWVTDMHSTCRTLDIHGKNSVVTGIALSEFQSRLDIWGNMGAAAGMCTRAS